jgi:phosphopantothenoylcysteine decarboxylase/phosphopantothenate--cysteine ligase
MWRHAATRRNVAQLRADGVTVLEPDEGEMACGEFGPGRLPEPERILEAIGQRLQGAGGRLSGKRIVVTAGPTHEPIDPVRVVANRSSGKQGFAIAAALAELGAEVSLVAGPVALPTPQGVRRVDVETAVQMHAAVEAALPAHAAVLVAAVADWSVAAAAAKLKKKDGPPQLAWSESPDILAWLARSERRPRLLVGFAAETQDVVEEAQAKRARKGADWIVANDVSGDVMGGEMNEVHLVTAEGVEHWQAAPKEEVARRLAERVADALGTGNGD